MTLYARRFLDERAVDPTTARVTLDLMEDIWAQTDLTPYPDDDQNGDLCLLIWDGHGRYYEVGDGAGGLPTQLRFQLKHDQELLVDFQGDGSFLSFAQASNTVCNAINTKQREQERREAV